MKSIFTSLAFSLAVSVAAAATTCNHSNAKPWPTSSSGCNGNAACEALAAEGQCNSQTLIDGGECVKRRSTGGSLQCSSNEMCYLYTDGDALCIDWTTGAYHDETGGKGNAFSGAYTAADGSQTTNLGGAATSTSRTSTRTRTTATTTGAAAAAATATTSGTATATSQQSAASATKTGAASDFRGDAAKAAWAVAAPMLLVLAA